LVIRNSRLSPKQQAEFSRQFGELEPNTSRNDLTHPDDSDVLILTNEIRADGSAVGVVDAGEEWHSDLSFASRPAMATLLQLIKQPNEGGDTAFSNLYLAYDALPASLKKKVEGRNGIHHISKLLNPRVSISTNRPGATDFYKRLKDEPGMKHPLVRTHPDSGRQALFISPRFTIGIDGMDDAEAQPLLDDLFKIMDDPRFEYRHQWSDNDFVMWDNRCLNHRACGGYRLDDLRRLHRTCVRGSESFYRAAA
jgi:taurine dioxygenase